MKYFLGNIFDIPQKVHARSVLKINNRFTVSFLNLNADNKSVNYDLAECILSVPTEFIKHILGIRSGNRNTIAKSVSMIFYFINKKYSLCDSLLNSYLGGWSWNHCYST